MENKYYESIKADALLARAGADAGNNNGNRIQQIYGAAKWAKQTGQISSHELSFIKEILFSEVFGNV